MTFGCVGFIVVEFERVGGGCCAASAKIGKGDRAEAEDTREEDCGG